MTSKLYLRLGYHETLKDALARALEDEAVRQDHRSHHVREVVASPVRDRFRGYSPKYYACGEKGSLRSCCPKQEVRAANSTAQQQQGKRKNCGLTGAGWRSKSTKGFNLANP